jgi:hypothetical protein
VGRWVKHFVVSEDFFLGAGVVQHGKGGNSRAYGQQVFHELVVGNAARMLLVQVFLDSFPGEVALGSASLAGQLGKSGFEVWLQADSEHGCNVIQMFNAR